MNNINQTGLAKRKTSMDSDERFKKFCDEITSSLEDPCSEWELFTVILFTITVSVVLIINCVTFFI